MTKHFRDDDDDYYGDDDTDLEPPIPDDEGFVDHEWEEVPDSEDDDDENEVDNAPWD